MRILMIGHFVPYPPRGGSLQRTFNLLREVSRDNELHLLALNQRPILQNDRVIDEAVTALKQYCRSVRVFKIESDYSRWKWYRLLALNVFSKDPYSVWRFRSAEMAKAIAEAISKVQFDVVHLDTIDLAQYYPLLSGLPVVLNHHNIESVLLWRRGINRKNLPVKAYLCHQAQKIRRYESVYAGKANVNLVCSAKDKELLQEIVPIARIEVIPNGTDVEYFRPGDGSFSRELVFVGGLNWYPNRDAMEYFCHQVLPLVTHHTPEVILHVIGQDPPRSLRLLAQRNPQIKLHGYADDIRPIVQRAAVFVVPLRVGGGTRLKILDAFACGKAVVSTTIGAEGIEAVHGQHILLADTAAEFANCIVRVLEDGHLRRNLEKEARRLAETRYSWHIIGQKLVDVYRSLTL